jgi:hypothetical protein
MILNPLPILPLIKPLQQHNIKLPHHPAHHTPQLHHRQPFPRAIIRARRKRNERVFPQHQFRPIEPSLGYKVVWLRKVACVAVQCEGRDLHNRVAWDEVLRIDSETRRWRYALRREVHGGPAAHGFVDDGVEEGERALAVVCGGVGDEFVAEGACVVWVRGEVHEDEGQGCGGCFAAGGDDEAGFAVEEGAAGG